MPAADCLAPKEEKFSVFGGDGNAIDDGTNFTARSRSSRPPAYLLALVFVTLATSVALVIAVAFVGMQSTANKDDIHSLQKQWIESHDALHLDDADHTHDNLTPSPSVPASSNTEIAALQASVAALEYAVAHVHDHETNLTEIDTKTEQIRIMYGILEGRIATLQQQLNLIKSDVASFHPDSPNAADSPLASVLARLEQITRTLDTSNTVLSTIPSPSHKGSLFKGSGYWATKSEAQLPSPRSDFPAVPNPSKGTVYILGGLDEGSNILDSVLEYDPLTHEYKTLAAMPSPRHRHGAALVDGKVYVAGGFRSKQEADVDATATMSTDVYDIATNTWTAGVAQTKTPHGDTCMAAAGGKLYLLGGYGQFYGDVKEAEVFDPATGEWNYIADMSTPRGDLHCAAVGGKVYAIGGFYDPSGNFAPDSFLNTVEVFDPATGAWSAVASMPNARGDMAVAVIDDNHFMVLGGETHARGERTEVPLHEVEVYSVDTNTWQEKAPIPTARFRFAAAQVAGEVYVFGGHSICLTDYDAGTSSCPARAFDSVEVFFDVNHPAVFLHDPQDFVMATVDKSLTDDQAITDNIRAVIKDLEGYVAVHLSTDPISPPGYSSMGTLFKGSGYWATKSEAQLPSPRSDFPAVPNPSKGTVYILGGLDEGSNILDSVLEYDPLTHEYKTLAAMPSPRHRHGAALVDGKVYVAGGFRSKQEADVDATATMSTDVYDIATNTWTAGVAQTKTPHGDTCMAAAGGKLYLLGGYGQFYGDVKEAEVFDPATGEWNYIADMSTPRGDLHCAAVGGKVYAIGGFYDPSGNFAPDSFLNTVEVFDPATGAWSAVASMPNARGDMAVAVIDDNHFMVLGGETHARGERTEVPLHEVEVYSVDTNTWQEKAPIPTARFRFAAAQVAGEVYVFGGHSICLTDYDAGTSSCPARAFDSVEVFFDVNHPEVFQHVKSPQLNPMLTGAEMINNIEEVIQAVEDRPASDVLLSFHSEIANYEKIGNLADGSGYWATKSEAQLPSPRSDFPAVPNPSKGTVYILGGLDEGSNILDSVLEYDPLTHEYKTLAAMPSPRHRHGAALVDGKVYVAGGFRSKQEADVDATATMSTDVYDIATNTWTAGVAQTKTPHGDTCMAAAGGKLYLLGGYGQFYGDVKEAEVFDPATGEWNYIADMSTPRGDLHCAAVGGKVYAIGGFYDPSGNFAPDSFLNTVEVFDPATGAWSAVASMPNARGDMAVAVIDDNHFMVLGGETHARGERTEVPLHEVEVYSVDTNTWQEKAPIPTARFRFAAAQVAGEVYVFGGHSICLTDYDAGTSSCPARAFDSVEVYFDTFRPALNVYAKVASGSK